MPYAKTGSIVPTGKNRNTVPYVKVSNFQTANSILIPAGTPIGLLLALTYAVASSAGNFGDFRPNVRISNI